MLSQLCPYTASWKPAFLKQVGILSPTALTFRCVRGATSQGRAYPSLRQRSCGLPLRLSAWLVRRGYHPELTLPIGTGSFRQLAASKRLRSQQQFGMGTAVAEARPRQGRLDSPFKRGKSAAQLGSRLFQDGDDRCMQQVRELLGCSDAGKCRPRLGCGREAVVHYLRR